LTFCGHQPADALSPGHRDLSSGREVPAGCPGAQDLQAANGKVEGTAGLARGPAKDGPHGRGQCHRYRVLQLGTGPGSHFPVHHDQVLDHRLHPTVRHRFGTGKEGEEMDN